MPAVRTVKSSELSAYLEASWKKNGRWSLFYLEEMVSLAAFCSTDSGVQSYLTHFVQQAPCQPSVTTGHRAISPVRSTVPFATQLRCLMRDCASGGADLKTAETNCALYISAFWNVSNAEITYCERSLAASIRYQHRGQSQLLVVCSRPC